MTYAMTSINKISTPDVSTIYPRTRLFACMERALQKRVVWVEAPPGSGKSTFVASYLASRRLQHIWYQVDEGDADIATLFYYLGLAAHAAAPDFPFPLPLLTKEYQLGPTVFTRRYFEELFSRLAPPAVIVLDDYDTVSMASSFHEIISCALEEVPAGFNVVLISRNKPPAPFARLHALRNISFITWEDLRLNQEEIEGVLEACGAGGLDAPAIGQLLKRSRGWLAGIVFMLERGIGRDISGEGALQASPAMFDYFASELFDKTEPMLKEFLLKTSLLERFTAPMACQLTGNSGAKAILEELHTRNFFTEKYPGEKDCYQYHPLFREFLVRKARELLAGDYLVQVELVAAQILEAHGQIEHAAELYIAGQDWHGIAGLIVREAHNLIAQGRSRSLEGWIESIQKEATAEFPWLSYWLGVCRFSDSLKEGRRLFERAFRQFWEEGDAAGAFLAWSGVANALHYEMDDWRELDQWLALLDELLATFPEFPSSQVETRFTISVYTSLVLSQTDLERLASYEKKLAVLLDNTSNVVLRMKGTYARLLHSLWTGDYVKMRLLLDASGKELEQLDASPLARVMVKSMETYYYWLTARGDLCRQVAREGLDTARTSGVHIFDSRMLICMAKSFLLDGDLELCAKSLSELNSYLGDKNLNRINYYFCSAYADLLAGKPANADGCLDAAEVHVTKLGSYFHDGLWHLGKAQVFFAMGKHLEAPLHASKALRISVRIKSSNLEFMSLLTTAWFQFRQGEEEGGLQMLEQGLTLGRLKGYEYFFWWDPGMIASLCVKALDNGIEVEYVRDLARRRHLVPDEIPLACERWPWPVEIYTLGEFYIAVDGRPLKSPGKVQKKPLEMLKALVALGGAEKQEGQLADFLWPDADGDTARSSFKVTLHRLRQLLGYDDVIKVRDGKVAMDPHQIWCDVWTFEYLLNSAQVKGESGHEAEAVRLTEKALALFRGQFLAGEIDKPWATPMRNRLEHRYILNIVALGKLFQIQGEQNKAISCYLNGLEVAPQSEEIYQCLMLCQFVSGFRAEALTTYNNCLLALAAAGLAPSSQTTAIYRTVLKD